MFNVAQPSDVLSKAILIFATLLCCGVEMQVTDVQFSPDGYILASAAADGQVKLWDLRAGKPMHTFQVRSDGVPAWPRTLVRNSRSLFPASCRGGVAYNTTLAATQTLT